MRNEAGIACRHASNEAEKEGHSRGCNVIGVWLFRQFGLSLLRPSTDSPLELWESARAERIHKDGMVEGRGWRPKSVRSARGGDGSCTFKQSVLLVPQRWKDQSPA